jgi:flagellar hook-basal body complex protein FliE
MQINPFLIQPITSMQQMNNNNNNNNNNQKKKETKKENNFKETLDKAMNR